MTTTKQTSKTKPAPVETTAIATYGEWTPEQMEEESKTMSTGGDFFKVPQGNTNVRFLPPKIGWKSPFVIQHQHFIDMPGLDRPVIFCCPKMHQSQKCLACAKADAMEASGNARDERAARRLRPAKRVMANIVVNPKDPESKVQIYAFGKTVYEQLKAIRENDEGGGNFMDPIKGFTITIKRVGAGKDDTKYTLIAARAITPLANMDWIEVQGDLRRLIRIPTVDQQKRLFDGEDARDVWGDGDGGGSRRSSKPSDDDDAIDADAVEKPSGKTAENDLFDDEVDLD